MILFIILMLAILGMVDSCTIGQVCYKCRGNVYTCNDGSYFYTTAEDCISYVMSSSTRHSAHYKPSNTKCFPYTCTNNMYFSDSTRFTIRKTCNPDCTNFTLSQYGNYAINDVAYSSAIRSLGQCFEDCFDTASCYAFSYGSSVCSLYTSCGSSCSMFYSYGTTSYTRTCHTETDCSSPEGTANGDVDTPSGTTYNNQATYTCFTGYTLVGSSTRTCQSDGQWSGSAPSCNAVDCGSLTSPTNGAVDTSSGTEFSNQAVYSCSGGYSLVGSNTRTCQSDGQWSGSAPSCNAVDCGSLTSPTNGAVNTSSGTEFSNQAVYTCSGGHSLVGSSTRTCQSDGQWSGSAPSCSAVDCGSLTSPTSGAVDTSSGTEFSDQAVYSCSGGYTLVGSSTRTCQGDGQWSGSVPLCSAVDCGSLTSPTNGAVDTSSGTEFSDQAVYSCSGGYTLVGSSTRTCQSDGQWSGSAPSCNAVDCGSLTSPTNGAVDTSSGTEFSDQAVYSCSGGYSLVGSSTRTCQSDGQWSGSAPSCNAVDCGSLTSPSSGAVDTSSGTEVSNQAVYTCSGGHSLVGSSTRTCQSDGQWSGSVPLCSAVDCGSLTSPTNGAVDTSSGTEFSDQAVYSCSGGYSLVGSSTRTCQSDGQWSGSTPSCNAVDCGSLTSPTNGAVDTSSGTEFSDQAVYSCSGGHTLVGSSTRTCQSDGQWSGSAPLCSAVDCGSLTSLTNGAVNTSSGTTYFNQAVYSCLDGYTLTGNSTRMCQNNGVWSGLEPSCVIVDCGLLSSPENGYVQNPVQTTYLEQAYFSCSSGYALTGPSMRACLSDGIWNGTSPTCQPLDCGIPITPTNGVVAADNGTTYGARALFSCSTGYEMFGESIAVCNESGVWNSSIPDCDIIDCGLTAAPGNGTVQYSSGTTYGAEATFQCNLGYYLSHGNNRTCLSNGVWSMTTPLCVENGSPIPEPVRLYLAPCICYPNKTFTGLSQDEIIRYLIEQTRIEPNSTALAQSRLNCAEDPRMSSRIIGSAGLAIIAVVFGFMIFIDVLTLCQSLRHLRYSNLKEVKQNDINGC